MIIEIDLTSNEALYVQLKNRIIYGIATGALAEGDALPSVRKLSDDIGINMHTVNKAYSILREEGLVKVDRRGAFVSVDMNKRQDREKIKSDMLPVLARASCKGFTRNEIHSMIDEIYKEYEE